MTPKGCLSWTLIWFDLKNLNVSKGVLQAPSAEHQHLRDLQVLGYSSCCCWGQHYNYAATWKMILICNSAFPPRQSRQKGAWPRKNKMSSQHKRTSVKRLICSCLFLCVGSHHLKKMLRQLSNKVFKRCREMEDHSVHLTYHCMWDHTMQLINQVATEKKHPYILF